MNTPAPRTPSAAPQEIDAQFDLKSLAYLAALVGFTGSIIPALVTAVFAIGAGDWISAIASLLFAPLITGGIFALYALLGYPIYRRLLRAKAERRRLRGNFQLVAADAPPAA